MSGDSDSSKTGQNMLRSCVVDSDTPDSVCCGIQTPAKQDRVCLGLMLLTRATATIREIQTPAKPA